MKSFVIMAINVNIPVWNACTERMVGSVAKRRYNASAMLVVDESICQCKGWQVGRRKGGEVAVLQDEGDVDEKIVKNAQHASYMWNVRIHCLVAKKLGLGR